jgi:1-acyl-sn-glycerol-3-phosphate acyltransferase
VVRAAFRLVARPVLRLRVEGTEHLPAEGPIVLVAPHRSWLDPPCLGAACPRPVRFLIMESVFAKPWGRWFYRRMLSVPVAPGGGRSLPALRHALRALARGGVIGVFPEGRVVRPGERGTVHPGAAMLAVKSGCPVVPAAIEGTARAWPPGRRLPRPAPVRVRFLPPLQPEGGDDAAAVEALRRRIERALLDETP